MPYLEKSVKDLVEDGLLVPSSPGHLNYIFTKVCKEYLDFKGESYQHYNDIIGALECCKLEMYRRKVSVYEDKKIQINGDVF